MKKYWNNLFAVLFAVLLGCGIAGCSDDDGEIPASWYGNFGYLVYELYPDNNVVPAITAEHDARGVHTTQIFKTFKIKLKRAVDTDTEFKLGIEQGGEYCIPENGLRFLAQNFNTGEITDQIVVPAGKAELEVRVLLSEDLSFAESETNATTWTAPVCIREISNKDIRISTNRNRIEYQLAVNAYRPNQVGLQTLKGANTSIQKVSASEDLSEYFEDMQVALAYPSKNDVTVQFKVDDSQLPAGATELVRDAVQFEINGGVLTGENVTIPAGSEKVAVRCKLLDRNFTQDGIYALPLVITEIAGDEIEVSTKPFFFQIELKGNSLSFEKPASDKARLETDRSAYKFWSVDHQDKLSTIGKVITTQLTDGNTGSFVSLKGLPGLDLGCDFGAVKEIVGFKIDTYYNWGDYCVKEADIYKSDDGQTWVLVHKIEDQFPQVEYDSQYVSFGVLKTRYLKFDIRSSYSGTTYLSEFSIFVKK